MLTCHSDFGKIKFVFVKGVTESFISQEHIDRDWKTLNYLSKPDRVKASAEYQAFEELLKRSGAIIHRFPQDEAVSIDSIYCRDASIATDGGIILCNMGKPARLNEPSAQRRAFEAKGFPILGSIDSPGTLEGGDVAWLDYKTLAVGHTYRTNEAGISQLKNLLAPLGVTVITVSLPHYNGPTDVFHLMSILSPIDKDLAVVYSPLMPIVFRNELLDRGFKLIEVPDSEFESMGCNVLATGPRQCLMVNGNSQTREALEGAGCSVSAYDGSEISIKGGGGPTCLTRPMQREVADS